MAEFLINHYQISFDNSVLYIYFIVPTTEFLADRGQKQAHKSPRICMYGIEEKKKKMKYVGKVGEAIPI